MGNNFGGCEALEEDAPSVLITGANGQLPSPYEELEQCSN